MTCLIRKLLCQIMILSTLPHNFDLVSHNLCDKVVN